MAVGAPSPTRLQRKENDLRVALMQPALVEPDTVAVCISGQSGRMLPSHHIIGGLVAANLDIEFKFFFNLQLSDTIYTTKFAMTELSLSKLHGMTPDEISKVLRNEYYTAQIKE